MPKGRESGIPGFAASFGLRLDVAQAFFSGLVQVLEQRAVPRLFPMELPVRPIDLRRDCLRTMAARSTRMALHTSVATMSRSTRPVRGIPPRCRRAPAKLQLRCGSRTSSTSTWNSETMTRNFHLRDGTNNSLAGVKTNVARVSELADLRR